MDNRKTNKRYNRLLTGRRNYFDSGSNIRTYGMTGDIKTPSLWSTATSSLPTKADLPTKMPIITSVQGTNTPVTENNPDGNTWDNPFNSDNIANTVTSAVPVIGAAVGNALAGGRDRGAGAKVGGVFNTVGDVAAAIPGPWGAIAGGAAKLLGGLATAAFGYSLNSENLAKAKGDIDAVNMVNSSANSFDTLAKQIGNTAYANTYDRKFYGRNGWFNKGATRVANRYNNAANLANARMDLSYITNAQQLTNDQMSGLQRHYSAYGGPLDFGDGAIGYDFMDRYISAKENSANNNSNYKMPQLYSYFANGGSINIKPSKRGTFTAAAKKHNMGVQEFASRVLANKEDYSPAMVKKANFARNASKWHSFGGELNTQGLDWTNGLLQINAGGSHESNPNEGVLMGMDPQGTPNLVEEGETIWNDYVFSDRIRVPKSMRNKYKLGGKKLTFADASKKMAKESEERPNDPISARGLEALLTDLAIAQEEKRAQEQMKEEVNYAALGGKVNKFDGTSMVSNYMRKADAPSQERRIAWEDLVGRQLMAKLDELANLPEGEDRNRAIRDFQNQFNGLQDSYYNDIYNRGVEWGGKALSGAGKAHQQLWNSAGYNNFGDNYNRYFSPRGKSKDVHDTWVDNIIGDLTLLRNMGDSRYIRPEILKMIQDKAASVGLTYSTKDGEDKNTLYYLQDTPEVPEALESPEVAAASKIRRWIRNPNGDPTLIEDYYDGTDIPGYTWAERNEDLTLATPDGIVRDPVDEDGVSTTYTDYYYDRVPERKEEEEKNPLEGLRRYDESGIKAPMWGALGQVISDIFTDPDYTEAAMVEAAARNQGYNPIGFRPVGEQLTYRPQDINYALNSLNANAAATRRAINDQAGLSRGVGMAALLAQDNNTMNAVGNTLFAADANNFARQQAVEDFNRQTANINSAGFLQADQANQQADMQARHSYMTGIDRAAQLHAAERNAVDAARSANLTNLFDNIGAIGRYNADRNMINYGLYTNTFGPQDPYALYLLTGKKSAAKGGKLKRKNRRGLTH